jgi:HIV Tat-specific factor 1
MFTLDELEEDAAASLDIKEDVREECEKFGQVTNVVLYDKEEDGVMTVRFSDARAANACVEVFDGRWFDKRQVVAYIADGKERFKKAGRKDETAEDELKRLEKFGKELEAE